MKWWTILWSSCRVFAKPYNLLLLATLALTFFLYRQVVEHLQNGKIAHVFSFYFLSVDFSGFSQISTAWQRTQRSSCCACGGSGGRKNCLRHCDQPPSQRGENIMIVTLKMFNIAFCSAWLYMLSFLVHHLLEGKLKYLMFSK